MSDINIKYQAGNVTGGYAFSANDKNITLPGYVEKLPEADQKVIIFEATTARQAYIDSVAAKKAAGEKVNPLKIKREAVAAAKEATVKQFGEEEYNRIQQIIEKNKGGSQSVSGKSRSKGASAPKKSTGAVPADDGLDLAEEFEGDGDLPADAMDGAAPADPFEDM